VVDTTVKQYICMGDTFEGHSAAGYYYDTLKTTITGCDSIVILELQNYPPVVPSINQDGDTLTSTTEPQYLWFRNDTAIEGDTNKSIIISQSGNYYVQITDSNGCHERSAQFYSIPIGINNVDDNHSLVIFPNPNTGLFNVELTGLVNEQPMSVKIYNAFGQYILDRTQMPIGNEYNAQLDLSQFAKGIYLLQIQQGNWETIRKIVLE